MSSTKYEVVRRKLLASLEARTAGDLLPPERVLAADFGVSRETLRRVLDDMAREGYVSRRQGSGTYVSKPRITQRLTMTSFSEDMRQRGLLPGSRTTAFDVAPAGASVAERLEVPTSEPVVSVTRVRLADSDTMAIEHLHVPQALVPGLTRKDLDAASFYDLLEHRYGVRVASGEQTISATVTTAGESELLRVPEGSPAFLFERTTRDPGGSVIEFVRSIYRGDRYRLSTTLEVPRGRRGTGPASAEPRPRAQPVGDSEAP